MRLAVTGDSWQSTAAAEPTAPPTVTNWRYPSSEALYGREPENDEGSPDELEFKAKLRASTNNTTRHDGPLSGARVAGDAYLFDKTSNLSPTILSLIGRRLYNQPDHPISITKKLIQNTFPQSVCHNVRSPVVTVEKNFDSLGFPEDHPGRSRTDTYYVNSNHVLRTHTSAHQAAAFEYMAKHKAWSYNICADVYRRDSIDRSHFPVFHQMEGAHCFRKSYSPRNRWEALHQRRHAIEANMERIPRSEGRLIRVEDAVHNYKSNPLQTEHDEEEVKLLTEHLKLSLESLIDRVFTEAAAAGVGGEEAKGKPIQIRWVEAYFPFTSPSFELEVFWQGEWLELLGCGIVQQPILKKAGLHDAIGWAWGLGVERLAMLLFGIPDIRLFWSTDHRFLSQFQEGKITKYEPFSKYPACYKDVAFWIPASPAAVSPLEARETGVAAAAGGDATKASPAEVQPAAFHENDVMEIVRDIGGTLVEDVKLVDEFVHPKSGRKSLCYRINYRSLERTLTNEEVNDLHRQITEKMKGDLGVELR
ncbi:Phenylalanine--tRNA ligase, mitochondrial [Cyphellophora attinorum]|uniref:Phenylalanine--tRNA ligase, mitochondrial n=1 Tax=Cyphellophora attinorum TaxID=1664694 RepID=A0A0N1HA85_9EURO|nr:Phenylalanine--tRNA ligase, mitochondrial [Phialophora attinorum]KPI40695.1 Phenylalanine--tRNA ligase, mitochondrial [Phialophora attinorum]